MRNYVDDWLIEQSPEHMLADEDHIAVPDDADSNCLVCGLAVPGAKVCAHGVFA